MSENDPQENLSSSKKEELLLPLAGSKELDSKLGKSLLSISSRSMSGELDNAKKALVLEKAEAGDKFQILGDQERHSMLEDLFEFDKIYYRNNLNIELPQDKTERVGVLSKITNRLFRTPNQQIWTTIQKEAAEKKGSLITTMLKIGENLTAKGIPHEFRPSIWKFLIGNQLRINRTLFAYYLKLAVKGHSSDSLVQKDIDRTFSYFTKSKDFGLLLIEASYLLQMFVLYRPDMKYIQGMSYLMVMLLIIYSPYQAFKLFCNLVLCKKVLFDNYSFKKKAMIYIHSNIEDIVQKRHPKTFKFFKEAKVEVWNIIWVEWLYAMFLRTFDLKTCFVLWDFMLVKSEFFLFKLNNVVFQLLEDNFDSINKDNFFDSSRAIIISNTETILRKIATTSDHDFDINFAEKNLHLSLTTFS